MPLRPKPLLCSEEAAGCPEGTEPRRTSQGGVEVAALGRQRQSPRRAPPASSPPPPPLLAPALRPRLAPLRHSLSHSSRCFAFLPRLPLLCPAAGPAAGRNSWPVQLLPAWPPHPWPHRP